MSYLMGMGSAPPPPTESAYERHPADNSLQLVPSTYFGYATRNTHDLFSNIRLTSQPSNLERKNDGLKEVCDTQKKKIEELEASIKHLEASKSSLAKEIRSCRIYIEDLKQQVQEGQREVSKCRMQVQKMTEGAQHAQAAEGIESMLGGSQTAPTLHPPTMSPAQEIPTTSRSTKIGPPSLRNKLPSAEMVLQYVLGEDYYKAFPKDESLNPRSFVTPKTTCSKSAHPSQHSFLENFGQSSYYADYGKGPQQCAKCGIICADYVEMGRHRTMCRMSKSTCTVTSQCIVAPDLDTSPGQDQESSESNNVANNDSTYSQTNLIIEELDDSDISVGE